MWQVKSLPSLLLHVVLIVAALTSVMRAAESEFEAGNRAFDEKKYIEARQHYETLVGQGIWTANLFYNLGSANQQIGADGLAMLNYERALTLDPQHRDGYAALDLARKNSSAKVQPHTWRETAMGALTFDQWVTVACAAGWLFIFIILLSTVRRRRMRLGGRALCVISLLVAAAAGAAAWLHSGELNAAIVVAKQVEARVAPADRASLADTLPAGSRVEWLTERSGWVECRLPSGTRAWVPSSAVERIRLSAS